MKEITIVDVTICGVRPLLFNNSRAMMSNSESRAKNYDPEFEAEVRAFRCYDDPAKQAAAEKEFGAFALQHSAGKLDAKKFGAFVLSMKGARLVFPSDAIHAAMISVSSMYKAGVRSVMPFVCGSLEVKPDLIPCSPGEYGLDTRRVVVNKSGIFRVRPKLEEGWELTFELHVSVEDFPAKFKVLDSIREMLEEAGRRCGIGDFRLQKKGKFGKFEVVKWVVRS